MNKLVAAGLVFVILGALALVYQQISYTDEETIFEAGGFEASLETEESIAIPQALGIGILAGGGAMLLAGLARKK